MPVEIRYKHKTYMVSLTSDGFKLKSDKMKNWEYVRKEHIIELCSLLNATQGWKAQEGRLKINIPIEERIGLKLTKQRGIIFNTALITCALFPKIVRINGGFVVSNERIPIEEYSLRFKEMFTKEGPIKIFEEKQIKLVEKDEEQMSIVKFA
jgi:hypothetical protein